jgi:hypothetical protein
MNVEELIKYLQAYPSHARVVVPGYEGGYDDITLVKEISIKPTADSKWYYGRYEKAEPETTEQSEQAVLLFGKSRSEG